MGSGRWTLPLLPQKNVAGLLVARRLPRERRPGRRVACRVFYLVSVWSGRQRVCSFFQSAVLSSVNPCVRFLRSFVRSRTRRASPCWLCRLSEVCCNEVNPPHFARPKPPSMPTPFHLSVRPVTRLSSVARSVVPQGAEAAASSTYV